MIALKIILAVLTAVYPLFMVILSGAGLVLNSESYGQKMCITGVLLILSGILLAVSAIMCILKKYARLSVILSVAGLILCMTALYVLVNHADANGWNSNFRPVSNMYKSRIMPVILQSALTIAVSVIQEYKH